MKKHTLQRLLNKSFWVIPLLLVVIAGYYYYQSKQNNKNQLQYVTAQVKRGDIAINVLATGQIQAYSQVNVGAQATGQISKLYVALGDEVEKGEVIAEINPDTQNNELSKAQAQLKNNQASLKIQQTNLDQAQRNLARQQMMFDEGAASKQSLENAQTQVATSKANLSQAKLQIEQSKLTLKKAQLDRSYTTVKAPSSGTVIFLPVKAGQTINAVQSSPTIATIAKLDNMKVKLEISEADVSKVKAGMPTHFSIIGDTRRYDGKLISIDPAPTNISNNGGNRIASGTPIYYYGTLDVPNPDGSLRMYMTANAVIEVEQAKNVLSIPVSALQGDSVKVLKEDMDTNQDNVHVKKIKTGLNDGINVQVLSGLKENDTVIISEASSNQPSEVNF